MNKWHRSAVALALVGFGCVAVLPYTPSSDLVASLGADAASARIDTLMQRSFDPPYTAARVEADTLVYDVRWNVFGVEVGETRRLPLARVERAEIYENGVVEVLDPAGHVALKTTFKSLDDAREFADLITSFVAMVAD